MTEGRQCVLLVDDEALVRRAFVRELRKSFDVRLVASGEEGLSILDGETRFAAVVSDLIMGDGASGMEFLQEVGRRRLELLCVLVSGSASQRLLEAIVASGVAHHALAKPLPPGGLVTLRRTESLMSS